MLTAGNTPKHRLRSQKRAQLPLKMPITLLFFLPLFKRSRATFGVMTSFKKQMNRRGALRTLAFASVCGGACGVGPGRWLLSGVQAGETAVFRMSFDDFPQLKNSYGSVRLKVPGIPSSSSQIVVTRMPDNQFYAVTAKCPHKGVAVNPFKKGVGHLSSTARSSRRTEKC